MAKDKGYRLFGKIGVLDIIIILGLIAGVLFAVRFSGNVGVSAASGQEKVTYSVLLHQKKAGFDEFIIAGQTVFDSLKGGEIGTLKDYNIKPHKLTQSNLLTGQLVASEVDGLCDIEVFIEADAKIAQSGVLIGDYDIGVGKEMFIKTKSFASSGFCVTIDLGEEQPQ